MKRPNDRRFGDLYGFFDSPLFLLLFILLLAALRYGFGPGDGARVVLPADVSHFAAFDLAGWLRSSDITDWSSWRIAMFFWLCRVGLVMFTAWWLGAVAALLAMFLLSVGSVLAFIMSPVVLGTSFANTASAQWDLIWFWASSSLLLVLTFCATCLAPARRAKQASTTAGHTERTVDITEDEIRRQRNAREGIYVRQMMASSLDAIISVDTDSRIDYWNDGARRLFGYQAEEVIGEDISMLVPADRQNALAQLLRAALVGDAANDRDLTVRTRAGRELDVSISTYAVSAAQTGQCVAVMRDIHQRRIGERRVRHVGAQLVRRAQELQAIFDIAPVGMAIADSPDCLHVRPNRALARILGLERAGDVNFDSDGPYVLRIDGRIVEAHESPLHAAVAQRAAIVPIEMEILVGERTTTVMAYGAPVIDQDDMVVGAIAVFVDITAMKHVHAERQALLAEAIAARGSAEEASRLKEEFLATVSHELRTPLNAMHGWLEIMQRKPDAATQARGLEVIRRNVRAQTRVIEDILDVSAFITGKARVLVAPIDLMDIARTSVDSLRPAAEAKNVALRIVEAPEDAYPHAVSEAPVNGDPERLQQVIWNLLSNAVKFTREGGQVVVDAARDGSHFRLRVRDSGEGIDPAFLPFVFDRFRQADSSIERRHAGLGLGLAIVRHLCELHGGTVSVHSEGLGKGATFEIRLAARVLTTQTGDASTALDATHRAGTRAALSGLDVVIVDDDPGAAEMMAHALSHDGALVRLATSAKQGLEVLNEAWPDVVISDIGMPERDGYAFINDVRMVQAAQHREPVFALAITAYARDEDRVRALAAGFDAYLVKPVAPSRVTALLAAERR